MFETVSEEDQRVMAMAYKSFRLLEESIIQVIDDWADDTKKEVFTIILAATQQKN